MGKLLNLFKSALGKQEEEARNVEEKAPERVEQQQVRSEDHLPSLPVAKSNRNRETRILWRDEATLRLLEHMGGKTTTAKIKQRAIDLGWRFSVRTHLRRLASCGVIKLSYARNSGIVHCYWQSVGGLS